MNAFHVGCEDIAQPVVPLTPRLPRLGTHRPDLPSGQSEVALTLDGQAVTARRGETILQVADRLGVPIPRLCAADGLRPDGNCRSCVVEIAGERSLAPSCCRNVEPGMVVEATSTRARKAQNMVLELLLSDLPQQGYKWSTDNGALPHGELSQWAHRQGVSVRSALADLRREVPVQDLSHPAIAVNLDTCIQCGRCARACREEQVNGVIGLSGRGADTRIVFDMDDSLGGSSCVGCGECVQACPTGALSPKTHMGPQTVDRQVDSVCPFCGVGCQLTYNVREHQPDNTGTSAKVVKIVSVTGRNGPANAGRLCVKGRFGFDYIHHPDRLTVPLIRRVGVAKDPAQLGGARDWREVFREATWEEAIEHAAGTLQSLRDRHGPKSLAGFGSAKGSNEEAYLFQKLVRVGFGNNNVDHCTRLCHASSVAALLEGVGSGAVSNPVSDVEISDLIVVIGSNPTANHPVAATWMKNAVQRGTRLVIADPRRTDLASHAWRTLTFQPGTDVLLLNALLYVIFDENLVNHAYAARHVDNLDAIRAGVAAFSPEVVADACNVSAGTIREVARAYAAAKAAMILWGMGVSQHTHGTDNVRCLIALATVTGQIGRPGTGLHPLRGQNNVQGASDAGLIPMMYPNYQRVTDSVAHGWFENFWGAHLDREPGYTVIEIMHKALAPDTDPHKVRGMYVMGENPAMSDPDLNHARHALASLEHLVVQDIFLTETAWLADVVLPASAWPEKWGTVSNTDRTIQMGRQALPAPGEARADLWIIQQLAHRLGRADGQPMGWTYDSPNRGPSVHHGVEHIFEEMRLAMHAAIGGVTWERLLSQDSVTYPCLSAEDPGQAVVFLDGFPTPNGRAQLVPTTFMAAAELPDGEFPTVLITGRQLEHWHTGSMSRRTAVLSALEPVATASLNAAELAKLGLTAGDPVRLTSRRGSVTLNTRLDDGTPSNTVFVPFAYAEAAINLLTHSALDPHGKIPEFKYCAVRVEPITV